MGGANLQGKVECTLRQSTSPIFEEIGEIWTVGVDNFVVLGCCFECDD